MSSRSNQVLDDKAIRLIEYLLRIASLRTKLVRDISQYDRTLWISDVPHEKRCFTQAWGRDADYDSDVWLEVQNQPEPELPVIPAVCQDWVVKSSLRDKSSRPALLPESIRQVKNPAWFEGSDQQENIICKERLEDHPKIQRAWDLYIEEHWSIWVSVHNTWESVHKVYSSLFAIHQEQLRLGEEYELVLGLGLLTWQTPTGQRVRRHLVVANALMGFEARLGKFTVQPNHEGASIRPELDMLDIEDQPVRAEETAKSSLSNCGDDPWEKDCLEGVLKSLVHSINSEGEYRDTLDTENVRVSAKPVVEYAPALILRKRSAKGLTDILNKIKQRIENGEDIPGEFADLAEIRSGGDVDTGNELGDMNSTFDGEVFFPKLSNKEQRRIVDKIRAASGVLVQGPPGTGKSHTIANLICHLLATGNRILVTAKTPRALQVLMGKIDQKIELDGNKKENGLIPEEIKPLCISLLGSGLEERKSLKFSVEGILRKNKEWDEKQAACDIEVFKGALRELREEKVKVERRLYNIRESETHSQSISEGAYQGTAARIAEAVNRDSCAYEWFTDTAPLDKTCPISGNALRSILEILRHFTPQKRRELNLAWPEALPSTEGFTNLVDREKRAIEEEARSVSGADENISYLLSKSNADIIAEIRDALSIFHDIRRKLSASPYAWMHGALLDVMGGNTSLWRELSHVTRYAIASIETLSSVADETSVDFPDSINIRALLGDVCKLKEHMKNGGKLGWGPFRPKLVKECIHVIKTVRVNGRHCSSRNDFAVLSNVLSVRIGCEKAWGFWVGRAEKTKGPYRLQMHALKALCDDIDSVLSLEGHIEKCRETLRQCPDIGEPVWTDEIEIDKLIKSCRLALSRHSKRLAIDEIRSIEAVVSSLAAKSNAHPVTIELLQAIKKRDVESYAHTANNVRDLDKERQFVQKVDEYVAKMRKVVPKLIEELERTCNDPCWEGRISNINNAWHWAQARYWIEEYIRKEDAPALAKRVKQIEDEINATIAKLASLHAWSVCFSRFKDHHQRHMVAWQQSISNLVKKGTGRHAPRHRREAQHHLNECREAVPAWVMPLHRIWDTVEPAPGMFDVIIVDEASQCGYEAIPLFYLGKKILIVGDDKQISPDESFVDKDFVFQLMEQYLYDFKFKDAFHREVSLFNHAQRMYGTSRIVLREHFRCMPEIIRFSNDLCYSDTPLIPLRQYGPNRLKPLEHIFVSGGYREGSNNRVINRPEAEAIVQKIVELCKDDRYAGKTMGVVVLQGQAQAGLIEGQLLEQLGAEEMERRRLVCGHPYSFQGDERDIIFLSMVAAPNERIGTLDNAAAERRFNVAASRARDQMYLFHSVTCDNLSKSCLRRKLLEFFENTTPQEVAGINQEELERKAIQDNRKIVKPPKPFDSWFEVDVALELMRKGFIIKPQFEVAGKWIDLVVEGGNARLAVECDGDIHHGADRYEDDMERQRMLERCGWEFFRVRESVFYANKDSALQGLWQALKERDILPLVRSQDNEPQEFVQSDNSGGGAKGGKSGQDEETDQNEDTVQPNSVRIGSTVVYINEDDGSECQALITSERSNPEWGTINSNTPIAKALLGAEVGQVIVAHLPGGAVRLKIVNVSKP